MSTVDSWAGAARPESDIPTVNTLSGWSSYRRRAMLRILSLLAAVGVTVAAFWLPTPFNGTAGTNTNTSANGPAAPPAPTASASASPSTAPSGTSSATSSTTSAPPSRPATVPGTPTTPPPKAYDNTAAFTGISDGAAVDRCERLSGRSSVAPTKTLLTAHRRISPNDGTYYFFYVEGYQGGNTPPTWTTRIWFGSSGDGHLYTVYLLIMEVEDARRFWEANKVPNGSYADGTAIPASAVVANQVRVEQTGVADC